MAILAPFLRPCVEPSSPYSPGLDVVAFAQVEGETAAIEVVARPSGAFRLRCTAWVGWRDAGGDVRGHSWWQQEPHESGITDSIAVAKTMAEEFARSRDVSLGPWVPLPDKSLDQSADRVQRN